MTSRLVIPKASDLAEVIGIELERWPGNCHGISLEVVRNRDKLGEGWERARVARGFAKNVPSQHSWVVLGDDPYSHVVPVVDPTMWHYMQAPPSIWHGTNYRMHAPHGSYGTIWDKGMPPHPEREVMELEGADKLSEEARSFLDVLGPMDLHGWMWLANAPVQGWPASEIIGAMYDDVRMRAFPPIDIVGMLTDRNPRGLYLPS